MNLLRFLVRRLDDLIRKSERVFEFTQEPGCILRLQVTHTPHIIQLPDLTVEPGATVLLIHLWNERLQQSPPGGPDLAWARWIFHHFHRSLGMAAAYLLENPRLDDVRAVGGVTILTTSGLRESGNRFLQDMGFVILPYSSPLGRFGEFWENFYSYAVVWTFNPNSLPKRSLIRVRRSEMWMSREAFLERYTERRIPILAETA